MEQLGNPTPQGEQTEQGQPLDFTPLLDENGKILGKYDNPEAAKEGYWNAVQEMNRTKEQLNTAVEIIRAMQQGQPQLPQAPVQQSAYEQKLEALGIPSAELGQFVEARAQKIAAEIFQKQMSPLVQGASARTRMTETYPDFRNNESTIVNAARSNPALASRFDELLSVEPYTALELAYFHWLNSSPPKTTTADAARRAAQMPTGGGGVNRTSGLKTGPSAEQIAAAEQAFRDGDARPMFALRMEGIPLTYSEQMAALMRGQ